MAAATTAAEGAAEVPSTTTRAGASLRGARAPAEAEAGEGEEVPGLRAPARQAARAAEAAAPAPLVTKTLS
jgi:hypothetical protein